MLLPILIQDYTYLDDQIPPTYEMLSLRVPVLQIVQSSLRYRPPLYNGLFFSSRRTKNPYIDSCLKPLYNGRLFTTATFFCTPDDLCREVQLYMVSPLTLSLPEWLMEFCKVTLTFESVDEILRCDHSNESSLPALSHSAICFPKLYKMKFANSLEICLWLHLVVKRLKLCNITLFSTGL